MKKGVLSGLVTHISQTGQDVSGLRSDLRSRLGHFWRCRSAPEQLALTEDFGLVLAAWGIDDPADIPGVVRALRFRFPVFAVPVLVCLIAAVLLQTFVSCLALAFVSLPCLLGIVTTAWRVSVLEKRCFLPLFRWLFMGVFTKRP